MYRKTIFTIIGNRNYEIDTYGRARNVTRYLARAISIHFFRARARLNNAFLPYASEKCVYVFSSATKDTHYYLSDTARRSNHRVNSVDMLTRVAAAAAERKRVNYEQ